MSINKVEANGDQLVPLENEEMDQKENSFKKRSVSPIWIISILLHLIVIASLAYWVVVNKEKIEDLIIVTEVMDLEEDPIEEPKEVAILKEKSEVVIETESVLPPQVTNETVTDHNETDNNMEEATAEGSQEGISDSPQVGSGLMGNIGGGGGGGGSFGQRTGGGKKRAVLKGGGSKKNRSCC